MQEENSAPLEPQEDESDLLFAPNVATFDAAVAASDWTAETIVSQLRKGNIDLDPSFQRRQAWQNPRKSKFIESLILGIPTPQIILAERREKRGSYLVIDGKQRLLTLRQFTADKDDASYNRFRLTGLYALPDLNGSYYSQIGTKSYNSISALENSVIRTVIIKNWTSEDFLYEVFLRINSGSVQLSPQELRQALHPGPFTTALNEFALNSEPVRRALKLREPDFRMRDNELVLRYVATRHAISRYSGNLKQFLDETTEFFNRTWGSNEVLIEQYFENLNSSIDVTFNVFGQAAFKKWNGTDFERQINRAVFDVVSFFFSMPAVANSAMQNRAGVVDAFKSLCVDDPEFVLSITATTKSVEAVRTRFIKWREALEQVIGSSIPSPILV
ncbi:MAG: hypothetical protein C0429_17515 [Sphingopyxis sp.]|nr:hypothetical protein [Sphingopyxis sp.]